MRIPLSKDSNIGFATNVFWVNDLCLHLSFPNLIHKMTAPPAESAQHHASIFLFFSCVQVVLVRMYTFLDPTAGRLAFVLGFHPCPCVAPIRNGMLDPSGYKIQVCKSRRCPDLYGIGLIPFEVVGACLPYILTVVQKMKAFF